MNTKLSQEIARQFLTEEEFAKLLNLQVSEAGKIGSVGDLMLCNNSNLLIIADHEEIRFEGLIQLREYYRKIFLENKCQIPNTAQSKVCIRHHSPRLNSILSALPSSSIIEVKGPSCSGKSCLVFDIALQSISLGQQVLYIDIDLSFPSQKFIQILKAKSFSQNKILMNKVTTIKELYNLLESITTDNRLHNSILIIDSLSTIFFTMLSTKASFKREKPRILAEFAHLLMSVTFYANLVTFYTMMTLDNFSVNDLTQHTKPKLVLEFEKNSESRTILVHNNILNSVPQEEIAIDLI